MSSDVHFLDDKAIAFGGESGDPVLVTLNESLRRYDDGVGARAGARTDLLLWALIKATRDVGAKLDAMTQASGDQAAATREQTAAMQSNIDDARADAPSIDDVISKAIEKLPSMLRGISASTGMDLGSLMGEVPKVTHRQNGGDR